MAGFENASGSHPLTDREVGIVSAYESAWGMTEQMLNAARTCDWDGLDALEQQRGAVMKDLMANDGGNAGNPMFNRRKADLVTRILAANEEVKSLARARMTELQKELDSTSTERKLRQAYGG